MPLYFTNILICSLPENDQRLEEIGEMIGNDHLNKITQEQIIQYHTLVHDRLKYLDDIVQVCNTQLRLQIRIFIYYLLMPTFESVKQILCIVFYCI